MSETPKPSKIDIVKDAAKRAMALTEVAGVAIAGVAAMDTLATPATANAATEVAATHEAQSPQAFIAGVDKKLTHLLSEAQKLHTTMGVGETPIAGGGTDFLIYARNPSNPSLRDKLHIQTGPDGTMKAGGLSLDTANGLTDAQGYPEPKLHYVYNLSPLPTSFTSKPKARANTLALFVIPPNNAKNQIYTVAKGVKLPSFPNSNKPIDYSTNSGKVAGEINYILNYAQHMMEHYNAN